MSKMKTVLAFVFILMLVGASHAQPQDAANPDTIMPDDSPEMENRVRREKFDKVLPRVMRDNNIDMWIHIMRPWTPDPLRFDMGADEGVFIFTDRGSGRIERIAYGQVKDPEAYDEVFERGMRRERRGDKVELDIRFVGLREMVAERDPQRIGVNYMYDLALASSANNTTMTDGISHKDYNLLIEALGEKYASRVRSAEYAIIDFEAGRVAEEIELYAQ